MKTAWDVREARVKRMRLRHESRNERKFIQDRSVDRQMTGGRTGKESGVSRTGFVEG